MKLTPFCSDSFLLSNEYIISLIALLVVEKFGCDQVPSVARFLITYSNAEQEKVISQYGEPLEMYLNHRGARYMSQIRGSNRPLLIRTDSH